MSILFACIARIAVRSIGTFLKFGLAGDLLNDVWDEWHRNTDELDRRKEIEELATLSLDQARTEARQAVSDLSFATPELRRRVEECLTNVPATLRRRLRSPTDPSGRSLPPGRQLSSKEDLWAVLPLIPSRFKPGDFFNDWELEELLGVGGFGEVWKAHNPLLPGDPPVALKFITNFEARDRISKHETRVLSELQKHACIEGVVPLLATYLKDDPPCLVFEYVEGYDLEVAIRHRTDLPWQAIAGLVQKLCSIVGRLHRLPARIVHCDLKPANILLRRDGTIAVTDFGIGWLAAAMGVSPRETAAAVPSTYTPLYASPQQVAGDAADPCDDVFSLGVIWYQLLTGDPHSAPTGREWERQLQHSGMPAGLIDLLASMVGPQRDARPANAAVVAARIEEETRMHAFGTIQEAALGLGAGTVRENESSESRPILADAAWEERLPSDEPAIVRSEDNCVKAGTQIAELQSRVAGLNDYHDRFSRDEQEELARLCTDIEIATEEDDLQPLRQRLAYLAQIASRLAPVPPARPIEFGQPKDDRPRIPDGAPLLLAVGGRSFRAVVGNERYAASRDVPEGMVVALTDAAIVFPLWRYADGHEAGVHAGLPGNNWSVLTAQAVVDGPPLHELTRSFTQSQSAEVFRSMTRRELDAATGYEFSGEAGQALGEEVLYRFRRRLEEEGARLLRPPAHDNGRRTWQHADPIGTPIVADGWSILLDHCGEMHTSVRKALALQLPAPNPSLYLHQALALHQLRRARSVKFDVVLTTPTASGKTNAFLPGVLSDLMERGSGGALFLYPLRALCQDQVGKIQRFLDAMDGIPLNLYPFFDQAKLPEKAPRLMAATPDKLNYHLDKSIIQQFLDGLRWVVIDEAHSYRGCFGINVALLLRRLLSFAPPACRLVLSSATLDNTVTFASALTGRTKFRVISGSAAPRHARYYYLAEASAKQPLHQLVNDVEHDQTKGLVFELGRGMTQRRAVELGRGRPDNLVFPFYSGVENYQELLSRLKKPNEPGVAVTTSSLEAGVDIADVAQLAICGFPRTRGSFLQMAGRAGRAGTGHVVYIPSDQPADLFYSRQEAFEELISGGAEPIYLNPYNPTLLEAHAARLAVELGGNTPPEQVASKLLHPGAVADLWQRVHAAAAAASSQKPPAPPSLRAIPGDVHVVLLIGPEGGAVPALPHISRSAATEGEPPMLVEVLIQENARREWPPWGIATRNGRFYWVEEWRRGKWIENSGEGGRASDAVFIWVRDVTEKLITPEDYRLSLERKVTLPEGREVAHYHEATLSTDGTIETRTDAAAWNGLEVESGRGAVSVAVNPMRIRWSLVSSYRCPVWAPSRWGQKANRLPPGPVEWFLDGKPIDSPRLQNLQDPAVHLAFTAEGNPLRRFRARSRRHAGGVSRIDLEEHRFVSSSPEPCSCGSSLKLDLHWDRIREEAPSDWWKHPVYPADRRFESDLAEMRLPEATPEATVALAYAFIKALPPVLFLDPGDVGASLVRKPDGVRLLLYDVVEGGTGICSGIPAKFPALCTATERLLERCAGCRHCGGEGCFGCLLPTLILPWPLPDSSGLVTLTHWPAGALAVLTAGANRVAAP